MAEKFKKVGIFMGSFDPFHVGHAAVVGNILRDGLVDGVIILIAPKNPWKSEKPVDIGLRELMIRSWFDIPLVPQFLERDKIVIESFPGDYSYIQLKAVIEKYGAASIEYYIIGGSDIKPKKWKEGKWILENFKILRLRRPGFFDFRFIFSRREENSIMISSSAIRSMIKEGKEPIPFINKESWNLIKRFRLYE